MAGSIRPAACAAALLLLAGCIDSMRVQTGYVADRDNCRMRAESDGQSYAAPDAAALGDKDRNAALLQLFCECMKEKDWKVSGCVKPPAAPAAVAATPAPPPTVIVVQSPSAQPAIVAAPSPAPAPSTVYEPMPVPTPAAAPVQSAAKKAKKKKKGTCAPPQTCPAPGAATPQTPAQEDRQMKEILERQ